MPERLKPAAAVDIKRARIMVVEDEKIMSTFILTNLRRLGILDLFAFENGAQALRELPKVKPDLIITDVHMQPMGGVEMVRQLRAAADNRLSSTPVIILSADSSSSTVAEVVALKISGYIVKPPNLNALAQKIELALSKG